MNHILYKLCFNIAVWRNRLADYYLFSKIEIVQQAQSFMIDLNKCYYFIYTTYKPVKTSQKVFKLFFDKSFH